MAFLSYLSLCRQMGGLRREDSARERVHKTRPGVRRFVGSETLFVMKLWFLWHWNQERESNVASFDHRAASCPLSSGHRVSSGE